MFFFFTSHPNVDFLLSLFILFPKLFRHLAKLSSVSFKDLFTTFLLLGAFLQIELVEVSCVLTTGNTS